MSTVVAKNVQVGTSGTATDNFTIRQPATPDGTVRIANGNSGTTTDLVTLTSSGNLGLGVTPSAWSGFSSFQLSRGSLVASSSEVDLSHNAYYDGSNWRYIANGFATNQYQFNGGYAWRTAPSGTAGNAISFTQAMTLNSSGNLLVGTTTTGPAGLTMLNTRNISWNDVGSGQSYATMFRQSSSADLVLGSGVQYSATANGFTSSVSTAWARSAVNVGYGAIKFFTAAEAIVSVGTDTTLTERARIDSAGNFLVGPAGNPCFQASALAVTQRKGTWTQNDTGQPYAYVDYYYGASRSGYILWNSGGLSLNNLSDVRAKKNIQDASSSLPTLNALRVRQFDWKNTDTHQNFGFIAQELHEVFPEAVGAMEDETLMWGVDNSKLVPVLVKAIQEQQALITALTDRITALESK